MFDSIYQIFNRGNFCRSTSFMTHTRVLTVVDHKWRKLSSTMNSIVMGEFGDRKPLNPVILTMVNKDAKILLKFLVDTFCLTISLWMVSCRCSGLDTKKAIEFSHNLRRKLCSSV